MLTGDSRIQTGSSAQPARDLREEAVISGAVGWSETGNATIKDVYVKFDHKGPVIKLTTSRGSVIKCSPDHLCFGRINTLSRVNYVYLHERSSMGFRVGYSSDLMRDLFSMQNLKTDLFNQEETVIDRVWIIETCDYLPRAVFMEKFLVFKYGLPNIPFSGKRVDAEIPDEMIREMFNLIDTPSRAQQLLFDMHMFDEHPHITVRLSRSGTSSSSAIQFVLFGGCEKTRNGGSYAHVIRIDSSAELDRAEHKQFKRKMTSHGVWSLEVTREDLEEAQLFVKTLSHLDNLQILEKIQLTKKPPFYILPASHLKIGMTVPILGSRGIDEDTIVEAAVEEYEGALYDFKVGRLHNYIANNWVVMSYSPWRNLNFRKNE